MQSQLAVQPKTSVTANHKFANNKLRGPQPVADAQTQFQHLSGLLDDIETNWKTGLGICNEILKSDPLHSGALRIRHQLVCTFFPEWHICMMRDKVRNEAFYQAFTKVDWTGKVALEIGTGSGLLAILMVQAGAEHVYTCESNTILANIATQVIKDNALERKITVIPKSSLEIAVGSDLPSQADILVTETLGSDFFNESIVKTVNDAKSRLLAENALVIPDTVRLHGCVFSSSALRENITIKNYKHIDLSSFNQFSSFKNFHLFDAKNTTHLVLSNAETLCNAYLRDCTVTGDSIIEFQATADGQCDGVMYWMNVEFDDAPLFSNDPQNEASEQTHWRQCAYLFDKPVNVKAGQPIQIKAQRGDEFLRFDLVRSQRFV